MGDFFFKRGCMDKQKALEIMKNAIKIYENQYINRAILFIYKNKSGEIETFEGVFKRHNFLHLTGVQTNKSPNNFYKLLLDERLSLNDFSFQKNGNTQRKLQVIEQMGLFLKNPLIIGYSNGHIYLEKNPERVIGNNKRLVLGFEKNYPLTLLNEDIKKCTIADLKVLFILDKSLGENEYNNFLYIDKSVNKDLLKKLKDKEILEKINLNY